MRVKVPTEIIFDALHDITREKNWEDRLSAYAEAWEKLNEGYDEGEPERVITQLENDIFDAEKAIRAHLAEYHIEIVVTVEVPDKSPAPTTVRSTP
jgi:hypothetical protein